MIEIRSWHLAIAVPAIFAVGIGLSAALGLWRTTAEKVPASYAGGELAGTPDPADIRGSYTLADVAKAFPVPIADLARAFGVSGDPAVVQLKTLETPAAEPGASGTVGVDSVRLFVARYLGLPYEPEEGTALPATAVAVLEEHAAASRSAAAPAASEDRGVKGRTTFGELAAWGVAKADLEQALGGEIGAPDVALRDYCAEKGIEFSSVKDRVQALVDGAVH